MIRPEVSEQRACEAVGANVRRIRLSRHLSAVELAREAGLGRATLTEIEAGRGNPTVSTLASLAGALSTTIAELLEPLPDTSPLVLRATEGQVVERPLGSFRLLHRMPTDRSVADLWETTLRRGRYEAPPLPPGTVAHAFGLEGRAIVGPAAHPVELAPGDHATFRADCERILGGVGRSARVLLLLLYAASEADNAMSSAVAPPPRA